MPPSFPRRDSVTALCDEGDAGLPSHAERGHKNDGLVFSPLSPVHPGRKAGQAVDGRGKGEYFYFFILFCEKCTGVKSSLKFKNIRQGSVGVQSRAHAAAGSRARDAH